MIQWTGASGPPHGMPHISFVPRKPVPLGCAVKCVCDGTSGVMMHIEIQEGKTRMWERAHPRDGLVAGFG
jgi:hypothetical protein